MLLIVVTSFIVLFDRLIDYFMHMNLVSSWEKLLNDPDRLPEFVCCIDESERTNRQERMKALSALQSAFLLLLD